MKINYRGKSFNWSTYKFLKNLFLLFIIFFLSFLFINAVKANSDLKTTSNIIVHRGDTLWSIANKVDYKTDPRKVINTIMKQNRLTTAKLIVGKKLYYKF